MAKSVGRPPKSTKGGLSNEQKGRILFFLKSFGDSDETYAKIAEDLGRTVSVVKKCVTEMKESLGLETEKETKSFVKPKIIKNVLTNLINNGLTQASAQSKINKAINSYSEEQQKQLDEATIYNFCMNLTNAGDMFITKTAGGNKGIAINNQGASERGDAAREEYSRPKNPNIYKIFDE